MGADHLLPQLQAEALIADKAFDAEKRVIQPVGGGRKNSAIPPKKGRKFPRDYDRELYKARHLIENFFARLKQFRAIATRYDKTARNFLAGIHLAASLVWLNPGQARRYSTDNQRRPRLPIRSRFAVAMQSVRAGR